MKTRKVYLLPLIIFGIALQAQVKTPKLVVGIVVDQMRYDYIYRYWNKYGDDGFKRLVGNGYFCKNTNYNYVPTYTAPGHTSIYTGTTPATHGIISNEWYVRDGNRVVYCAEDPSVKTVGSSSAAGLMSPKNMLTTTMGDELRIASLKKSKVIGVALKDRSAIMPAGHSANGAYWFDGSSGNFITSTHYMNELPKWVNDFNAQQLAKNYLAKGWNTLLSADQYTESLPDDNQYESAPNKKEKPVFPYQYNDFIEKNSFDIIRATPWGNTITKDMAIAALKGEQLGKDENTDMLCISFSSTDYVGHYYGPKSMEVEDVYLKLDKELSELLKTLDAEVGSSNYVLFLTADHGACDVPAFLNDMKIPGGYVGVDYIEKQLKAHLQNLYGDSLVLKLNDQHFYLNDAAIYARKLNKAEIENTCVDFVRKFDGIAEAYSGETLRNNDFKEGSFKHLLQKGYNHKRSGDVVISFQPAWVNFGHTGTTHGAEFTYDTHVPLIFYGDGIAKGSTVRNVNIVDIAPTVCMLLNIPFPNGCSGKPIEELFQKSGK